jgi:hypothetical protein
MNEALNELAKQLQLEAPDNDALRWAFAYACANHVRHLVEHPGALAALDVLARYAVAKALAGKAIEAADYSAYATVYNYGAYALKDPSSFDPVHRWQVETLNELANR